jgi:hypothetical protein
MRRDLVSAGCGVAWLCVLAVSVLLALPGAGHGEVQLVIPNSGVQVVGQSTGSEDNQRKRTISTDGRYVVIVSFATNRAPGQIDVNGELDITIIDNDPGPADPLDGITRAHTRRLPRPHRHPSAGKIDSCGSLTRCDPRGGPGPVRTAVPP